MAHSSWFTYAGMTRIYKHYELALRHPAVRMQKASFSSYGGGASCLSALPLPLASTLSVIQPRHQLDVKLEMNKTSALTKC